MKRVIYFVARIVIFLITDLEVTGKENIPAGGSFIVASNHLGRIDAVLPLVLSGRDDMVLLIARKYQKYAIWRFVVRHLDAVWLNRAEADFGAIRSTVKRLRQGEFLAIAPEGTRSKTETLQPGKAGTVFIAAKAGVPILPVAITGSQDRLIVRHLRRGRRSKVQVHIGRPFTLPPLPRQQREDYLQEHTDEIMCQIAAMLPPHYRGVYTDHPRLQALLDEPKNASREENSHRRATASGRAESAEG